MSIPSSESSSRSRAPMPSPRREPSRLPSRNWYYDGTHLQHLHPPRPDTTGFPAFDDVASAGPLYAPSSATLASGERRGTYLERYRPPRPRLRPDHQRPVRPPLPSSPRPLPGPPRRHLHARSDGGRQPGITPPGSAATCRSARRQQRGRTRCPGVFHLHFTKVWRALSVGDCEHVVNELLPWHCVPADLGRDFLGDVYCFEDPSEFGLEAGRHGFAEREELQVPDFCSDGFPDFSNKFA